MKVYEKFIGELGKLDPRSENFEKSLDENFIKFQEELDIPKQFQIRSANFVIHPIEISENGVLNQIVGKPLPDEITLDRIWKLYGSQVGTGKIDGETYFVDTERMAGQDIYESKLFIAPFFEKEIGDNYRVGNQINDTASLSRTMLPKKECKNGKEPQFEEESLKKASEALTVFFEKFKTSIKSDFYAPGQKLSSEEMLKILKAVKGVEPYGFSVKQLKNSSDPTCTPKNSDRVLFFKKAPEKDESGTLAVFSAGRVAITTKNKLKPSTITHEVSHKLSDKHVEQIRILQRLLNMSDIVPMSVMGASKLYLPADQLEKNPLGVLDYMRAFVSRYLSIKNKGDEKFKEISKCYEPLELFNTSTIGELEHTLWCEDGSKPTLNASPINIDEALKKFDKNVVLIEVSANLARGLAEIAGNVAKIDKKTNEAISSSVENATRLIAMGLVYGIESVATSIAVPVLVSGVKVTDAIITKASGSGLQDRIQSLSKCLIGDDVTNSISTKVSACYNSTPKYARDIASQIIFISMIYNILEIKNNMKEDEAKKSSAFSATLLSSLLTSVASGILRGASSLLVDRLFPSQTTTNPISNDVVQANLIEMSSIPLAPPLTPGTTLNQVYASRVGGRESGRVTRYNV